MGGGDDEDDDDDDDDEDDDDVASSPLPRSMGAVRRSVMHAGQVSKPLTQPPDHRWFLQLLSHTSSARSSGRKQGCPSARSSSGAWSESSTMVRAGGPGASSATCREGYARPRHGWPQHLVRVQCCGCKSQPSRAA